MTWKPIKEFPGYSVSDNGYVIGPGGRNHGPKILKPARNSRGYFYVRLCRGGKIHSRSVHSLVLATFGSPRPKGYVCDHINAIKTDNRVENLRWLTDIENKHHSLRLRGYMK